MIKIIIIIAAVAAFVLIAVARRLILKKQALYPYVKEPFLLSPAERLFMRTLEQSTGNAYRVFSKVRVADVISVKKGIGRQKWQSAFNRISSKHFDFILVRPDDFSVAAAIELDDKSHKKADRMNRDDFLDNVCRAANLKLLRFEARSGYSRDEIRQTIVSKVDSDLCIANNSSSEIPETLFERQAGSSGIISSEPYCPNCGAKMVRRISRSGKNAGQEFWGCTCFPKCRGIINI